jgi:hypothetical protein
VPRFKPSLSLRKSIFLVIAVLVLAGGGAYAVHRWRVSHAPPPPPTITGTDGKKITLAPPTQAEKQQADDHKSDLVKNNASLNSTAPASQGVTSNVVITSPSSANPSASGVRAYVNGVFEEGGTCTATATQGATSVTKSSAGFENVSYTQCAPIDWDSPLGSGKWTITVSYKSAATSSSQSVTIEVK